MNGLVIIVLGIIVVSALIGYYRGFLRVVYSLAAWILVLAFVTWATPYLTNFLEKNTKLKDYIQEKCIDYMEDMAEDKIAQGAEEYGMGQSGLLPESIMEEITGSAAAAIGGILEESGLYEEMAAQAAHYIIKGIAFFITMLLAGIITFWISHMLNLVSRIPAIQGLNKVLGAVAGGLKGLIIVWLVFYIINLSAASDFGRQCLIYIEESLFLRILYENNIFLLILLKFLGRV